jgi:hypothetical protein
MKKRIFGALAAAWCFQAVYAAVPDTGTTTSLFGSAFYQEGQIEKADAGLQNYQKMVDQRYGFTLGMDSRVNDRLRILASAQIFMWSTAGQEGSNTTVQTIIVPKDGEGIYTFGSDPASPTPGLQIALGYFPFKYDAEATNFGEYLLNPRTGTYPQYIITDFDNDESTVLGFRATSFSFAGNLRQDLLVTSEVNLQLPPFGDFSLGYLIGYKVQKMLDVGGGIFLNRVLPIAPQLTTLPGQVAEVEGNGDTVYYTKQGVKLMLRAAFDPKALLPNDIASLFGPEDGKLYSESAILGVKDYGADYNDVWQRNPRMVGFNIPSFRVLDVLSFELEYFKTPALYTNDLQNIQTSAEPSVALNGLKNNPWDWSIYAKKTLAKGVSLRALIGKDHYLGYQIDYMGNPTGAGGAAAMRSSGTWHYDAKVQYEF